MFGQDITYIFLWWLFLFFVGIGSLPITYTIFRKFIDFGYGFSKVFGLLIIAYAAFVLSTFEILPLKEEVLYSLLLLYLILNGYIFYKNKDEIISSLNKKARIFFFQEILFTFGLFLWSYVRAHSPDINGLEKFMDFGFINSILRSDYLPPADMWLTGSSINYYWFGHYFVAFLTKLTQIPSYITYNLMLATILGWGLTEAFSLSATLIKRLELKIDKRAVYVAGIISAIALIFAGNFHTPFYILKEGRAKYWYPDATRFIGYNPDTNDKTIHEFPMYSFVVSDLHAHLINLPFVLVFLAVLWETVSKRKRKLLPDLLLPGFLLGVMFMTSAWDFGNYAMATGFVMLLFSFKKGEFKFETIINTAIPTAIVVLIALVTTLPFMLHFESIAQGVAFVNARTPLWQLAILWGFPAILTAIFIYKSAKKWSELKSPDIFVLALLTTSWALIFLPEIIYVKDIYIASHHRANTMFKLTYQAFVMFYLTSGYITIRVLTWLKSKKQKIIASILFATLFASVFYYPFVATDSYYGGLKNYKGLDGEKWLKEAQPDYYAVILWFRQNVEGQPTILEAPGDSYTDFNVVSAYTGLPTVSGWFVHEWLWRGTADVPQARVSDITQIYTSPDLNQTRYLLNKYQVEYVIIGAFERQKFPNINEEKFSQLGENVFTSGSTNIYKLYQLVK